MDAVDREGGHDHEGKVDFSFLSAARLVLCGILICDLDLPVCVLSANRVTGADRLESDHAFKGSNRVKTFAGVTGKRNSQRMERLRSENACVGDQNCCRSGDIYCSKTREVKLQ